MKLFKLSSLAAASLLAAGSSFAYGPTVTPDFVIYGGGGAEQNAAFQAIAVNLLETTTGTLDIYTEVQGNGSGRISRAVFGKTKAAFGSVPAGSKVLIYYRSNQGVFANGIGPVLRGRTLPYLSIANATPTTVGTPGNPAAPGGNFALATPTYKLPAAPTIVNAVPDFGLANQEITLYTGVSLPPGDTELTPTELSNADTTPLYQVVNGIGVTTNLYAQKKNWRRDEIASILAGTLQDWSQINDELGNPLPAGPIILLDRNAGSGAKAGANTYFLNQPTVSKVDPVNKAGDQGPGLPSAPTYAEYTVQTLGTAGGLSVQFDTVLATNPSARAIGVIGRENIPGGSGQGANWRSVTIDGGTAADANGVAFVATDTISGKYDYVFQASFQARNKLVAIPNGPAVNPQTGSPTQARFNQPGTTHGALIEAIKASAVNPAVTTKVPGTLLDPSVVAPGDFSGAYDAFITRGTRGGNSQAPLILQF